jgi:hypothetical protein
MKKKQLLSTLALIAVPAFAANTLSHGPSVLFRGSSNLGTYATHAECVNAAQVRTITSQTSYECREALSVTPSAQSAPPAGTITGLDFAGNNGSWDDIRFRFTGSALLPMQPATYIWNLMPRQQSGYFTTFFHGPQSWPNSNSFYGAHPYPTGGTHKWEIAANFGDYTNDANGNNTNVQWGRWHTQALVVTPSGSNTVLTFYWDLPDANKRITATVPSPSPVSGQALSFGLAPWAVPAERLNGILRGIRLYSASLSQADILSEATSPLSTSAGTAGVWYMNMNPTPSDISDKSGRGHHPAWAGTGRPALWSQ